MDWEKKWKVKRNNPLYSKNKYLRILSQYFVYFLFIYVSSIYQPINYSLIHLSVLGAWHQEQINSVLCILVVYCVVYCVFIIVYCAIFNSIYHQHQQLLPSWHLPVVSIWFFTHLYFFISRFYSFTNYL